MTCAAKDTTAKQKPAAGIRVDLSATDPGAQPAGNQPGVSRLTMRFAGARVNTTAGRRCTLPKARAESCPRVRWAVKVARGKGKRRKALIATPRCGKPRRFKIVSSFVYDDSTRERVVTRQRCRR